MHGTYVKTILDSSNITLTKFPYRIDVFNDGSRTDRQTFYTQKDDLVSIMVCNHTYSNQLFLVSSDGTRVPVGFYDGLWIFDGKTVSHIETHTGIYLIAIGGPQNDQPIDPIYLQKNYYRSRYKQY